MKSLRKVIVRAPATTANLGPGFDVFGMALEKPYDTVSITTLPPEEGVKIKVYGHAKKGISTDPEKNTAGVVAKQVLKEFSIDSGLLIEIEKGIIPGFGLGSSAASAAAVAYGLNILFNLKLDNQQLVRFAAQGEKASAGFEHADNVSAAIFGGFVIIRTYDPLDIISLEAPENLIICVAVPNLPPKPKKTKKARAVLPKVVELEKLRHNVGHASSMAVGFAIGDLKLIGKSMSDAVVEPARASLIPGYNIVKEEAIKAGAYGVAISGAGPSMIAIVDSNLDVAFKVLDAMKHGFESAGVAAEAFYTKPGKGVKLLEAL
ncbi:homoserine kinase [Candidatus Bathyarchaeota archaeon]|nr:homoserine kinase [Candidatus Bathyarchaeota archaeon]